MSDFHKPDEDDGDEELSDEDDEEEEEEAINLEMIKAKFSSLSSALQETNKNLLDPKQKAQNYPTRRVPSRSNLFRIHPTTPIPSNLCFYPPTPPTQSPRWNNIPLSFVTSTSMTNT